MVFPQHVHQLGRELRSRDFRLGRLFAGARGDFHGDVALFGFSDAFGKTLEIYLSFLGGSRCQRSTDHPLSHKGRVNVEGEAHYTTSFSEAQRLPFLVTPMRTVKSPGGRLR